MTKEQLIITPEDKDLVEAVRYALQEDYTLLNLWDKKAEAGDEKAKKLVAIAEAL